MSYIPILEIKNTIVPKGEYSASTTYNAGDSVSYNGNSYVAMGQIFNVLPTDATRWQLMASKGDTGTTIEGAFTDLTDAPSVYTNQGGKTVRVKITEDGLEFGEKIDTLTNTIVINQNGGADFLTIAEAIAYLATLTSTDGYELRLVGGEHIVEDTITIDLMMPIIIRGTSSGNVFISAGTGLTNSDMFVIRSRVDFDRVYFTGNATWQAGTTATFLKYDTDGAYSEVQNFGMKICKKGIEITGEAKVLVFDYIIEDATVAGVEINAPTKAAAIDCEVGNMVNCAIGFNLLAGALCNVYLVTLRFIQEAGQTGIAYVGANFTYDVFTVQTCEWNNVGTFSSGFDFTILRDSNIEIVGSIGIEDKKPHAKINLAGNTTVTPLNANTWAKAVFTNTSAYSCKWGIDNNRMTWLSDHPRDVMMIINGTVYQATATQILEYAIVKNGNPATLYGKNIITVDQANRNFTIGTNVYLSNVQKNDYFELWIRNISDNDDAYIADLNWFTHSL